MKLLQEKFILGECKMKKYKKLVLLLLGFVLIAGCGGNKSGNKSETINESNFESEIENKTENTEESQITLEKTVLEIPEYTGNSYVVINDNEPKFAGELSRSAYEYYSELDNSGRCGVVEANLGRELMPTEERKPIGQVKPTGWKTVKYDSVDGKYLYNRCHLIGFQLSGENANERNLITGTRYMNTEGMLPFENMVADYIKETGNHVMYRVTPVFEGDNLVASGVQMEAKSVEDNGDGICFNVYVYNVQPGIEIDYKTGESRQVIQEEVPSEIVNYVLNCNTKKFHYENCASVRTIKNENRQDYTGTREDLVKQGYNPCGNCCP